MNRRTMSSLAWALSGIIAVATLVGVGGNLPAQGSQGDFLKQAADLLLGLFPLEFSILAALILSRQPRNAIGWLLMIPALTALPSALLGSIDLGHVATPPASPSLAFLLAVWFDNWSWTPLIFPILLIPLLFPTGRPPSPRWRWVIIYAVGMWACFLLLITFAQRLAHGSAGAGWSVANPIGFIPNAWLDGAFFIVPWSVGLGLLTVLCAAALFVRFRRAAAVEREQIKWLLYACGLFVVVYLIGLPLHQEESSLPNGVWTLLFTLSILIIPVAIAVAILRYRLWDINIIINRTLVYVPLTAIVAGIFSAVISLSQKAFVAVTGQDSLASTVLATLVVVALFNPIKDRVQRTVDKGFKEAPSPAKRLNAFQERVRSRVSEVDAGPITWRFLEEAVAAFDAEGGIAYLDEHGSLKQIHTMGDWKGEERLSVPVESAGARIACIALGRRRGGRDYADPDRKALEQVAQVVAQAIEKDSSIRRTLNGRLPS